MSYMDYLLLFFERLWVSKLYIWSIIMIILFWSLDRNLHFIQKPTKVILCYFYMGKEYQKQIHFFSFMKVKLQSSCLSFHSVLFMIDILMDYWLTDGQMPKKDNSITSKAKCNSISRYHKTILKIVHSLKANFWMFDTIYIENLSILKILKETLE